jgi:hypothetical protein
MKEDFIDFVGYSILEQGEHSLQLRGGTEGSIAERMFRRI